MDLKPIFERRKELMEYSCALPVGTDEWKRSQAELDEIENYLAGHMTEDDLEDRIVEIDILIENIFGKN